MMLDWAGPDLSIGPTISDLGLNEIEHRPVSSLPETGRLLSG